LNKNRKVVYIVDDDPAVRDSLKFALGLEGLAVRTHSSGPDLLRDKGLHEAECLVLDYRMPDMDGLAVLSELASQSIRVPVILITAPVSESLRRRAQKLGAFSVLEKPLLNDELAKSVRAAIAA
jgi:FixJ family two-component response regulator